MTNLNTKPTIHIVSLSSGISSAIAALIVIKKYGKDNVILLFADTQIEDDDNYRFLEDISKHLDKKIIKISTGINPYELFTANNLVPFNAIAPCTFNLKIKIIQNYIKVLQKSYKIILHIGMNKKDKGRYLAPIKNWSKIDVKVEYPLLKKENKHLDDNKTILDLGIKIPRMYELGYKHSNCGGLCVKQGAKDFRLTLKHFPERFDKLIEWENEISKTNNRTILTRTIDGKKVRYSFKQLKEDSLNLNEKVNSLLDDLSNTCLAGSGECGVGSDWNETKINKVKKLKKIDILKVDIESVNI